MSNHPKKVTAFWLSSILAAGSILFAGCGGGSGYPVGQASGTVTCEGKAVPGAWVFFEPLAGEGSALVGKQGFAIADENGKFVISTYGTQDGAVIGKHKVHVTAPKSEGGPAFKCPCEFDSATEPFLVEVKSGKNQFDLPLPLPKAGAKANNKPMSLEERDALLEAQQAELEAKANAKANAKPSGK